MKPSSPRTRARSVYRVVPTRVWNDARINDALPPPPPNARFLLAYLQTAPGTTAFPGLFVLSVAETAERFGWSTKATARELARIVGAGLAKWDATHRIVWLPDEIHANPPASPNAAKAWAYAWRDLPECQITREAREIARSFLRSAGEGFAKAFDEGLAQGRIQAPRIQDQEQEQEQEQDLSPPASAREAPEEAETETAAVAPPPPSPLALAVGEELRRAGDLLEGAELAGAVESALHLLDLYEIGDARVAQQVVLEAVTYGRALVEADRAIAPSLLRVRVEQKIGWILQRRAEAPPTPPPSPGGGRRRDGRPVAEDPAQAAAELAADAEASERRLSQELARTDAENAAKREQMAAARARARQARDSAPAGAPSVFTPGSVTIFGIGERPTWDRRSA